MARRLIATLNIDVQRVVTVTGGGRIFGVSTLRYCEALACERVGATAAWRLGGGPR